MVGSQENNPFISVPCVSSVAKKRFEKTNQIRTAGHAESAEKKHIQPQFIPAVSAILAVNGKTKPIAQPPAGNSKHEALNPKGR
jgi:hypothetical protein